MSASYRPVAASMQIQAPSPARQSLALPGKSRVRARVSNLALRQDEVSGRDGLDHSLGKQKGHPRLVADALGKLPGVG